MGPRVPAPSAAAGAAGAPCGRAETPGLRRWASCCRITANLPVRELPRERGRSGPLLKDIRPPWPAAPAGGTCHVPVLAMGPWRTTLGAPCAAHPA